MPSPSRNQRMVAKPLANMTVAAMQDNESFVSYRAAPIVPVDQQEGKYFTYSTSSLNRHEMEERGSGAESAGSGWTNSTASFQCKRYAVHHDEDINDVADADPAFDIDLDSADWLANQSRIHFDYLWSTTAMLAATWTTDWDGVASGTPTSGQVLRWDVSSSDPQHDVLKASKAIHALVGKYANVMVVGQDVDTAVRTNAVVRAALQYTMQTKLENITNSMLAQFFGIDQYIVAGGIYESAKEGATSSLAYIAGTKDIWLGYINPTPGRKRLSTMYTFAWKNAPGSNNEGVVARKIDMMPVGKTVERHELECWWSVPKIISADAGAFIDDCVS
jgi:hypothetical protein